MICWSITMPFWVLSFSTSVLTSFGGTTASFSPCTIRPEDGQGARNEKSYRLAGGALAITPLTSGRRSNRSRPIHDPDEERAPQPARASRRIVSAQAPPPAVVAAAHGVS